MHKVVVERPRGGQGWAKKFLRPDVPFDHLPKYQGIKRPHRHRKWFTDLLGPLHRWLRAQLGRPWDDVYSEACAVIKADSVVRAHIRTHLLEFVERNTFMKDGEVCVLNTGSGLVIPVARVRFWRMQLYVHPETGLLCEVPPRSKLSLRREKAEAARVLRQRWPMADLAHVQIHGLWFACQFKPVRARDSFPAYDHERGRMVGLSELRWRDGEHLLCVAKRQLSHRELRRHGLVNAPAGTQPSPHSDLNGVKPARNPAQRNRNPQPRRPYGKSTAPPRRRTVFSRSPASVARASRLKPRSSAASASSMATRSCARSSGATTSARAAPTAAFRNCCLRTGRYDGALRKHYSRE